MLATLAHAVLRPEAGERIPPRYESLERSPERDREPT
jgi:hypothetical protein